MLLNGPLTLPSCHTLQQPTTKSLLHKAPPVGPPLSHAYSLSCCCRCRSRALRSHSSSSMRASRLFSSRYFLRKRSTAQRSRRV